MINALEAARYLISLDPSLQYFNKRVTSYNGRDFYEGNARLNKMLHLAQNIYIGKQGEKLIDADFYAYDNGGVIVEVQENYAMLIGTREKSACNISQSARDFLHKIFIMLKDAPISELIDIDHEDPAWQEKHHYFSKAAQKMDSMKYADEYKDQYEAAIFYLDKLTIE